MNWSDVTAVFGGRFDPIHNGHLDAIRGLFSEPGIRRVLLMPTPISPLKPTIASAEERLEILKVALADAHMPGPVDLDRRELDRGSRSPGAPIYTYDTLEDMRNQVPKLAFVIGTDQWNNLPKWHRFPEILSLCNWIVLKRKGESAPQSNPWGIPTPPTEIRFVETPAQGWSSTQIREAISKTGAPPADSLPPSVTAHLKRCGLYGMKD